MEPHNNDYPFRLQVSIEFMTCVAIIGMLLVVAMHFYRVALNRARVIGTTGVVHVARSTAQLNYALVGEWPEKVELESFFAPDSLANLPYKVENAGQAFHVLFSKTGNPALTGRRLTFHPATPAGDPLGPVLLQVGPGQRSGWQSYGTDNTNINSQYFDFLN